MELDGSFQVRSATTAVSGLWLSTIISIAEKLGLSWMQTTTTSVASTLMEVDVSGTVLKRWDMAAIISAAMRAGGDDPSRFVYPPPTDWFHINGSAYNRADDSLIVSSRENFLICLDYKTSAIKWILGDTTKKCTNFRL